LDDKAKDAASSVGYGPSMDVEQVDDSNICMPEEMEHGKSTALSTSRKRGKNLDHLLFLNYAKTAIH